jgi:type II secretory pathway pseudopilin PulG
MIEMIGVLAVLGILAAVILSTTGRSLAIAAANVETTNLVSFSTALQNHILRNRYIPGPYTNDWATHIATELGVNVSSVTTNAWNIPRCFLIDPAMQIGANAAGVLPYAQTNLFLAGASGQMTNLVSPRVMIVSSLFANLPFSSGTPSSTDFNNLWNWTDQSRNAPSNWPTSWNNHGTALLVQRINLAPLFVHLTLQNYPPSLSGNPGQYAIDRFATLATNAVPNPPPANGVNAYLLKNTVLSLYQDAVSGGTLQADQVLNRDASFYYIQQVWRGTVAYGTNINQAPSLTAAVGSAFLFTAQAFVSSPYNTRATNWITPPMVVNDMSNFMTAYIPYAAAGAPGGNLQRIACLYQSSLISDMTSLTNGLPNTSVLSICTNPPTQ